jgi:hypothetical protein
MVRTQLDIFKQNSIYNYMFRPCKLASDDGKYTGPKHVVVFNILCENI